MIRVSGEIEFSMRVRVRVTLRAKLRDCPDSVARWLRSPPLMREGPVLSRRLDA